MSVLYDLPPLSWCLVGRFRRVRADCWYYIFVGFRHPMIILHVSFSVASSFFAWVERSHTGQAYSAAEWHSARTDDLSVFEWLPILRFLVCGLFCFLFRLSFWYSRYGIYTTTFGPVWRKDTQGGCSVLVSPRSSWCWAVCHIHDSAGGRG